MGPQRVLLLGASVRALASSAIRAGLSPIAIDRFGDLDLRSSCPTVALDGDPESLIETCRRFSDVPLIYGGAFENDPATIERISADRPLWGNPPEVLRQVRDPFLVAETLRRAGIPAPKLDAEPTSLPNDGSWLVKPRRSAGGVGIEALLGRSASRPSPEVYYQERIGGIPMSAIFIGDDRSAHLQGVARQWIGRRGVPFGYVGNVGPISVRGSTTAMLRQIGGCLRDGFGLRGLFGVDFILRDDVPWPIEVNPRYTASVEILEHARGESLLRAHRAAFDLGDGCVPLHHPISAIVGKAIVFAPRDLTVPEASWLSPRADPWSTLPRLADLPIPRVRIAAGEPVLTVFARGRTAGAIARELRRRVRAIERRLVEWPGGSVIQSDS